MVNSRIEILGKDYPLVKEIPTSFTYQQADIREPDKRNASFSKTIQLFGSNKTNRLFENIFSYNVKTNTFNVNKKTECKYFTDNILIFKGDLQLVRVTKNADSNIIYDCNIIGQEGTLFVDIGSAYLDELDFSEYDHLYTRDKIIDSWTNICDVATVPTTLSNGNGYLYGFVQRGLTGSDSVFNVSDFLPQFYIREYFFKILDKLGYSWKPSATLDSSEFKSEVLEPNLSVIPFSQTQINNSQWYVGLANDQIIPDNTRTVSLFDDETIGNGFFDAGNQYSGGKSILNYSGNYQLVATAKMDLVITNTSPSVAYASGSPLIRVTLEKSGNNGVTWFVLNTNVQYFLGEVGTVYPNTYIMGKHYSSAIQVVVPSQMYSAGDQIRVIVKFEHPLLASNWIYYYDSSNNNIATGVGTGFGFGAAGVLKLLKNVPAGNTFYCLATSKQVYEGGLMTVNGALPKKIKQKDFIKSIMQMYNLYIEPDKHNPKLLTIESYDVYFNNGVVRWDNKIDKSKDVVVNPLSLIDGKTYKFSYKSDVDFFNKKYQDSYSEVFGTEIIDIDNDFIKAEKKNELIFSPTPNVANYTLGIAVPKIYKQDPLIGVQSVTPNVRILYYGGIKQTTSQWTFKKQGATDLLLNDYPYVGHTDDPQTPNYDLNFGLPKEVYYNYIGASFTTNNLYNRFYKNAIKNTTSRDSRVIVAWLWLSPKDIYLFSFRKKYYIEGSYYIVNKIIDFNPNEQASTKCELIKILEANVFIPSNILFSDTPTIPAGDGIGYQTLNSSLTRGSNVNLGANCIAIGENIVIPASCSNVTVIGNNVVVDENVSNSSVINTNGYALIKSGISVNSGIMAIDNFLEGYVETADATSTKLVFNNVNGTFDVQQDNAYRFEATVMATDINTLDCKEWTTIGLAQGDAPLVYNVIQAPISLFSDLSMTSCAFSVINSGVPGNDFLDFVVTGIVGRDIAWKCNVEYVRIYT